MQIENLYLDFTLRQKSVVTPNIIFPPIFSTKRNYIIHQNRTETSGQLRGFQDKNVLPEITKDVDWS